MPPMISIVGKSGSGKTTLIEKLIPELKRRGFRIGTVKHTSHEFEMDKKGKDSTRHKAAGADTTIIAARNRIGMVKDMACESLDSLMVFFDSVDLVITEGYKREKKPKIEIYRPSVHSAPLYAEDKEIIALVTDADLPVEIPRFGLEDIPSLADFIEGRFL